MNYLEKVEPFKMKTEIAYDFLKLNILNGNIKPGEKIVVRKISENLNISDIPIREAILKLTAEGFLTSTAHIGARVVEVDRKAFEEITLIRCELEDLAMRSASGHVTEQDCDSLEKIIKDSAEAMKEQRYQDLAELNKRFHLTIYERSPYKRLFKMISDLWDESRMLPSSLVCSNERRKESLQEHRKILEALRKGDGRLAGEMIKKQKISAYHTFLKFAEDKIWNNDSSE